MSLKILSAVVILAGTAAGILMVTQARQARQDPPVTNGFMRTMHSDLLDEDRQLFVYLPRLYDPAKKERFPLFVFTDGRMSFKATAGMIHSLIEGGTIPRMVVVGIANTDRGRDLIPTKIVEGGNAGGGAKFRASLETEILPYIDANWPTNGFRVFSGHSLGGLTSLNILIEKPELFDAHIALSPSMEAGDGLLLDACRDFLGGREELDRMLYLAVGDEYAERVYFEPLVEYLRDNSPRGFRWESDLFDVIDDHMSVRVQGMLSGIRWVFGDWKLASRRLLRMTDQEIEAHLREASRRYKLPLSLEMDETLRAANRGLYEPELMDRAIQFARLAVERWPDEPYAHGTLGRCLEESGQLEEALKALERAVQICRETANDDHLIGYQLLLDRVKAKLGVASARSPEAASGESVK